MARSTPMYALWDELTEWASLWLPRSPVAIDRARPADAAEMARLHAGSFRRDWSEDEIEALILDPTVTGFLARRANLFGTRRAIGFVLVRMVAGEGEILTIAVEAARRGQGHGRALMDAAIHTLRRAGASDLFLEVDEANTAALGLYRAYGFVEVGRRKGYYPAGAGRPPAAALVMRRPVG